MNITKLAQSFISSCAAQNKLDQLVLFCHRRKCGEILSVIDYPFLELSTIDNKTNEIICDIIKNLTIKKHRRIDYAYSRRLNNLYELNRSFQ